MEPKSIILDRQEYVKSIIDQQLAYQKEDAWMDVNFEYYKVFYYVAKYKNFTKAAHALGSGQPNVTRAMNCLEQQTHCTLFIRTNRGVQLTPEGEMLFTHVEAAIWSMEVFQSEPAKPH